jgi:hypothetical protein
MFSIDKIQQYFGIIVVSFILEDGVKKSDEGQFLKGKRHGSGVLRTFEG